MPSMDEILGQRDVQIAEAVLGLVISGPTWRHRRIETLTPLSASIVRRRVSIDYTVPCEVHDNLRIPVEPGTERNDDQWVVPLGWLARRPLVSFDLRDGNGDALPMLLSEQILRITRDMLLLQAV